MTPGQQPRQPTTPASPPNRKRLRAWIPRVRSGGRLLREIATKGQVEGDTTTLEDFSVLAKLAHEES